MSATEESNVDQPHMTVTERLRERHGQDVDPKVELLPASPSAESAGQSSARSSFSSKVLTRLETRGSVASRYRLHGEIARGGMGAILEVYDEDLRRKLAMKVMLDEHGRSSDSARGKVDPSKLVRFLEEAQVTGQLDHPGIVPVHELGLDRDGQVYFTMRLVRGRDLAAIFRLVPTGAEGWTTTRAIGLLLKACEAMAYAHNKGVVHRDLKPANVMVGEFGEVYVMDWGLARVLNQPPRDADHSRPLNSTRVEIVETDRRDDSSSAASENLNTMDGDIMGTPSYMSPEQARGKLDQINELSDVYSMGAMLYRLLAGAAPYCMPRQPVRPVVVLEKLYAGPPAAIEELAPHAPAELVAICEKAMAREPSARYASMIALGEDLRAYLEGRVVVAYETGAWAETRKWVRRNRALAASLAAGVLALVAGLAASIVLGQRAEANAELAAEQRTVAETNAVSARKQAQIAAEINSFLNNDLLAAVAPEFQGAEVKVRDVLDQAASRIDARFASEPEIESELRYTIGVSYSKLGSFEPALEQLERAFELHRVHDEEVSDSTLKVALERANVLSALGRFDEAIDAYHDLIERARATFGAEHHATMNGLSDLGVTLNKVGRHEEARAAYLEALELETRVLGPQHLDTLITTANLALLDQVQGQLESAEQRFRMVLEGQRATIGERHPETLVQLNNLSIVLFDLGRQEEALELAREALTVSEEVFGAEHPRSAFQASNVGILLFRSGRPAEAEPLLARALAVLQSRFENDHPTTLATRGALVGVRIEQQPTDELIAECREVFETQVRQLGPEHANSIESLNRLACAHLNRGQYAEAEPLFVDLIDVSRRAYGDDHPLTAVAIENLANVMFSTRRLKEGESSLREVLEIRVRVLGANHPDVAKTTYNLGMVVNAGGDQKGALELFEDAMRVLDTSGSDTIPLRSGCLRMIGDLRAKLGEHTVAIEAYREALDVNRTGEENEDLSGYLMHQVAVSLSALGDLEVALAAYREAFEFRERAIGPDALGTRITLLGVAVTLVKLKRFEEAEPVALELHARALRNAGPENEIVTRARAQLVEIYEALGRPDDAAKWR